MTKKLETLFDLPESKEIVEKAEKQQQDKKSQELKSQRRLKRDMAEFDKIASALPAVKGLGEMADTDLGNVADKAMGSYDDLMNLGMNVEARYAGRIFEVAGSMLKTGLDAKVAKIDKKLKMVELQLKKEKLDKDSKSDGDDEFSTRENSVVTDRNSLMERLKNVDKDK